MGQLSGEREKKKVREETVMVHGIVEPFDIHHIIIFRFLFFLRLFRSVAMLQKLFECLDT
jgi:hypothetical protein